MAAKEHEQEITKEEFKKLYFRYSTPDSGWTQAYWDSNFEQETGKKYFFAKPSSPKSDRMFIMTDAVHRHIVFMTEESEESLFDNPGKP